MYTDFPLLPGICPGRSRGINTESKTERTPAECHLLHRQLSKQELEIKMVFLQSLLFYNLQVPDEFSSTAISPTVFGASSQCQPAQASASDDSTKAGLPVGRLPAPHVPWRDLFLS